MDEMQDGHGGAYSSLPPREGWVLLSGERRKPTPCPEVSIYAEDQGPHLHHRDGGVLQGLFALCRRLPQAGDAAPEHMNSRGVHPAYLARPEDCTGCTQCAIMCPDACLKIVRHEPSE